MRTLRTIEVAAKLFEQYEKYHDIKDYFGLFAIYGLARAGVAARDKNIIDKALSYVRQYPDNVKHPRYFYQCYRVGGIPKTYLFYKGYLPHSASEIREYAEELMNAPRSKSGILINPYEPEKEMIWVDTAMAVSPFLLYAGLGLKEPKYIEEGVKQACLMYDLFEDDENSLVHQCLNFTNPGEMTQDHWSRSNGWIYFAFADLLLGLPKEDQMYKEVEKRYLKLSSAIKRYQGERGLWHQEIPFDFSYEESSGTALFLYGLGIGLRLGILSDDYQKTFKDGLNALTSLCITDEFQTMNCCPLCCCPGIGNMRGTLKAYITQRLPVVNDPHSYGPFILALTEGYNNGITNIDIGNENFELK